MVSVLCKELLGERRVPYKDPEAEHLISQAVRLYLKNTNPLVVCIGTDYCSGDSYGPLVGYFLKDMGYSNVFGTLDQLVYALNLKEHKRIIEETVNGDVIAVDSGLTFPGYVGTIVIKSGPLSPGRGVGKYLGEIGTISITGNTNVCGADHMTLAFTRLSLVVKMAKVTAKGIWLACN